MSLGWAGFYHFRNLDDGEINTSSRQVFFIGKNGQGKTNLLEALYVLLIGSSFRVRKDLLLAKSGNNEWGVRGIVKEPSQTIKVKTQFQEGNKSFFIDENPIKERRQLLALQPVVIFSHEDFLLVSGPAEERRRFFDQTLIMMNEDYLESWRRYQKILRDRNLSLRQGVSNALLEVYEFQLAQEALILCKERADVQKIFSPRFEEVFFYVSQIEKRVALRYHSDFKSLELEAILTSYRQNRERDRDLGYTRNGPHRDRWYLDWGEDSFQETASTGQIRLASLCLKAVQAEMVIQAKKRRSIFLLDDVLLELDTEKRTRFSDALPDYEQAFYTFLPGQNEYQFTREDYTIYDIQEGKWDRRTNPNG